MAWWLLREPHLEIALRFGLARAARAAGVFGGAHEPVEDLLRGLRGAVAVEVSLAVVPLLDRLQQLEKVVLRQRDHLLHLTLLLLIRPLHNIAELHPLKLLQLKHLSTTSKIDPYLIRFGESNPEGIKI